MHDSRHFEKGSSLVAGLMLTALLSSLLAGYYFLTAVELTTTEHSMNRTRGFYSAEAGLNLRADEIRQEFLGYSRPSGTTPTVIAGQLPCVADQGAGDFRCIEYPLQGRRVATYVTEEPGNPSIIVIPPGEPYQNLNALEYKYTVSAVSIGDGDKPEAILELSFRSRVVPMFQFAAFYNKDLEITPGPFMTLSGPVHANGDIYAAGSDGVDVLGDMTMSGRLYQGKKEGNICRTGDFNVLDPASLKALPACSGGRKLITQAELAPWNGHVMTGVEPVVVPPPDALDPVAGQSYWDNADIRIMYDTQTGTISALTPAGGVHAADGLLSTSAACSGALSRTSSFFNNREKEYIRMLEVDMTQFMDCLNANPALLGACAVEKFSANRLE